MLLSAIACRRFAMNADEIMQIQCFASRGAEYLAWQFLQVAVSISSSICWVYVLHGKTLYHLLQARCFRPS